MKGLLCLMLCLLGCGSLVQSTREDDERMTEDYRDKFRHAFQVANISTVSVDSIVGTVGIPDFNCELNANEPTSIHDLSPLFVDVVAAMGDSVTAGWGAGARNIIEDLIEYRGLSWSIGGDKDLTEVATLPNILRVFNPDLYGFSIKTGKPWSPNARLNVAVSGAVTSGVLGQAETLVNKMKDEGITDDDWKVITLWIGANDLCAIKDDGIPPHELASRYVANVGEALDYLHSNVRRAFVNVAEMIDVADLHIVNGIMCSIVHPLACGSITSEKMREKVTNTVNYYNLGLGELVATGRYYDRDDFTVVLQPFFTETQVPRLDNGGADKSYFAPDCFHFSQKGHAVGARYLWNNMFEPLGQKTNSIDWKNEEPLTCPADCPYFATHKAPCNRGGVGLLNANSNDKGSPHSTNLLAILVGTGVGVFLVAVAAVAVAVGVVRVRRRNRVRGPTEKMQLLSFKS